VITRDKPPVVRPATDQAAAGNDPGLSETKESSRPAVKSVEASTKDAISLESSEVTVAQMQEALASCMREMVEQRKEMTELRKELAAVNKFNRPDPVTELQKEFATMNQSDQPDPAVYRSDQRSDPPNDYQPASSCKDLSSFQMQSRSGRCVWLSGILFLSLLLFLCTVCGGVEHSDVLYCDFGCDNKFPFLANFVTLESHDNADTVSWRPKNWSFTLLLCRQSGPLPEPIDENDVTGIGTEVITSVAKKVSLKDLREGLKRGVELNLVVGWIEGYGVTNDPPKVWVHDPGGEFGVTNDNWH